MSPQTINVTLNRAGVVAPAIAALKNSVEMVAISLEALKTADFSKIPAVPNSVYQMSFDAPKDQNPNDRQSELENWILSKAFQEIARGIRAALEQAYLYLFVAEISGQHLTISEFKTTRDNIERKAMELTFPALLNAISNKLQAPLTFEKEFLSFQRARNCLEHRNGIVGTRDLNSAPSFELIFPRTMFFVIDDGKEIELHVGYQAKRDEQLYLRRVTRTHTYKHGDRLRFQPSDIVEIAQACWHFVHDIETKLPIIRSNLVPPTESQ